MKRALFLVTSAAVLSVGGCAAPAIIATAGFGALQSGTEAFIHGELEAAVKHNMQEVFDASREALESLEVTLKIAKAGESNAYITARETQGRKIEIKMEMKSPRVTKLNIRVGVFGDQAVSRLILAEIQLKLAGPQLPAPAPSADATTDESHDPT